MTKVLKQTIKVIFALILLVVVFIGFLFSNLSMAWFAKNENVTANGFSATAKVSPNLIIAKSAEEITAGNLLFGVEFSNPATTNMIAVTHDETASETFLKYLTNHYAIDFNSGTKKEGYKLEFAPVPTDNNQEYFIDYTVYLASVFGQLPVKSLNAMITIPSSVDNEFPYFNAASIDFYVGEVSVANYRGTASVGNRNESVDLFKGQEDKVVPLNSNGYIKVIMRCYFDGALQDSNGLAYTNSKMVDSTPVSIGVAFEAIAN